MRKHTLTTETVQEAVEELLAQAAEAGKAATVTALANRLGVKRQTLYRDFDAAVTDFLSQDAVRRTRQPRPPKDPASDRETVARLRREKDELTRHLHIYEDHIRRLTIENAKLTAEVERLTAVPRLSAFRASQDQ
ncbi:hypothetical protein ADK57_04465 [Streptomyces sp. MMG1533]|uniref:hypothetical protein n=1 Tax=Streptomyces sp. MMG1533 TaxID=1415546 RepID=UPI0006B052C7|nr:hypothetical protein [Streptomyces sp. MMG1533]KOU76771.1 hypothetical protein ADK57_04465 [Streptomyces sp. MMG1533]